MHKMIYIHKQTTEHYRNIKHRT